MWTQEAFECQTKEQFIIFPNQQSIRESFNTSIYVCKKRQFIRCLYHYIKLSPPIAEKV